MASPLMRNEYFGGTGLRYGVIQTLHDEEDSPSKMFLALDPHGEKVILKYIHAVNYDYLKDELGNKLLPETTTKKILKEALLGIAELHDHEIAHTDIKPDNVLIDWVERPDSSFHVEKVQIADLEDAAHLPHKSNIIGKQAGNQMWRSPEAHAYGPLDRSSDIFSFALVMIYGITKCVIFHVPDSELDNGKIERLAAILDRQISYFGQLDSVNALIKELIDGDNVFGVIFQIHRDGFGEEHPRKPVRLWVGLEDGFKDLVGKMTDFDPRKRISAREALAHSWFSGV